MAKGILITIDGGGGVGSGTLARLLAEHYNFTLLDSGLAYRAITSLNLESGRNPSEIAQNLTGEDLKREDLRSQAVDRAVAKVASMGDVRRAVNEFFRTLVADSNGCVIDGRDMAFVFEKEAQVKLFLSASAEVRAERRHKERMSRGETATYEQILEDLRQRDKQDAERAASPFKKHPEAYEIDTGNINAQQVFKTAVDICEKILQDHP